MMWEQHWIIELVFSSWKIINTWGEIGFDVYLIINTYTEVILVVDDYGRIGMELEVATCWIGGYQQ